MQINLTCLMAASVGIKNMQPDIVRTGCIAADRLQNIAADAGFNPLALAVAWVARHKGITAPIVSARNRAQLAPSLEAAKINIDDQLYQSLCSLTPTPPPATDRLEEQNS